MAGKLDLASARAEAAAARQLVVQDVRELQARLSASALATDAWDGVRDRAEAAADGAAKTAARYPVATSAAALGLFALIARKPILRLFRRRTPRTEDTGSRTARARRNGDD